MSNKFALCIGINNYPGTDNDLSGCINDTNDWEAALKQRGFQVEKLLDKNATKKKMTDAIKKVISKGKSGDTVVIQYSGHGTYVPDENGDEPDGKDEALCPHDINAKGAITDDELYVIFSGREKDVKLIFLTDSCHSGTVSKMAPPFNVDRNRPVRKIKFLPPATFLKASELNKLGLGRAIRRSSPPGKNAGLLIAGCQDVEYSYDAVFNERPNGAFTFVALKTLTKLKAGATYRDWFREIKKMLPSQQYPQTPNLYGVESAKKWKVFE